MLPPIFDLKNLVYLFICDQKMGFSGTRSKISLHRQYITKMRRYHPDFFHMVVSKSPVSSFLWSITEVSALFSVRII